MGVSIGPGLTAFSRIPREISSPEKRLDQGKHRRLRRAVRARIRHPEMCVDRAVDDYGCWIREERQERLNQEKWPFEVDAEVAIERRLLPLFERPHLDNACVEQQNVKRSEFVPDRFRQFGLRAQVSRV